MGKLSNTLSILVLTLLLLSGGILMILSYVKLRQDETDVVTENGKLPPELKKGRQYAAISCSILIIVAVIVIILYAVVGVESGGIA